MNLIVIYALFQFFLRKGFPHFTPHYERDSSGHCIIEITNNFNIFVPIRDYQQFAEKFP